MLASKRRTLSSWLPLAAAFALTVASGCGDDSPTEDLRDTTPLFDSASFPDTADTSTPQDTATAQDTTTDTAVTTTDTALPDLIPDIEPPVIVETSPAAGETNVAIPFTVTITFDEPIYRPTIAPQTIKLIDFNGDEVPGTPSLSQDGTVVTFTPTDSDQQYASPYTIRVVGNIITDLAGNKFVNTKEFTFTTANYPQQDGYRTVAAKYAPTIYSAVDGGAAPHAQVPTKYDSDSDWNFDNNRDWLTQTATSIIPAVYYNVTETRTHYFVQYQLFFPWVNHTTAERAHSNGTIGYLVTVDKARGDQAERPIALHTYHRELGSEENMAFVTTESAIIGGGLGTDDWSVEAEMAQADLFPSDRFEAYVTAKDHRACLWGYDQGGTFPVCPFPAAVDNGDTLIFAYQGGAPTPFVKGDGGWPKNMAEVADPAPDALGYALIPILTTSWPRRFRRGAGEMFDEFANFSYEPDEGRAVGDGLGLTSKLRDSVDANNSSAHGRPSWAWGWNPANSSAGQSGFARIVRGQIAIDPAWYVWERHHSSSTDNGLVEYVEETGVGFSTDYCFNGFANIDNRATDTLCQ